MAQYDNWIGMTAFDTESKKLGTIEGLYVDEVDGHAKWVTIKSGLFGTNVQFAPADDASEGDDGILLTVSGDRVKGAPSVQNDEVISDEEEDTLIDYYFGTSDNQVAGDEGHDTSGPNTDDAMTRSEEQLNVGTRTQETGRVKLRKYVVVENVTTTVPVAHEEVRVEREAISADNVDAAMTGADITDEEHEMTLNAEVPVVEKKVVPVERIKLSKEVVADEVEVTDQVRKEQVDIDEDTIK